MPIFLRKKLGEVDYDRKLLRCGSPSQHAPCSQGRSKDTMLTLVIQVLTITLWVVAAVAVGGIALGFFARTILGRVPYRQHSRPVAAAIRWEKNWHR